MKIIFFGTPEYVLPILELLHKSFKNPKIESGIVAVVTQKPKPTGRKQIITYSPVDAWAHKKNIPIFYKPLDFVNKKIKADVGILASYGEIIPKSVIEFFKYGILNIHPSLLPLWRGSSPVQASIIAGDKITGTTIIKIDEILDHGPIVSQFKEEVQEEDTTDTLRSRLFARSAEVLTTLLPAYLAGKITHRKQDHKKATITRQIKKSDAFIPPKYISANLQGETLQAHWEIPFMNTKYSQASLIKNYSLNLTPYTLERFIRAMQPWPVSWTNVQLNSRHKTKDLKRLKIIKTHVEQDLSLKSSVLRLEVVQLEGKNPVSWKQFKEAYNTAIFE
jgi:methionyl-tRNA formyltransferase